MRGFELSDYQVVIDAKGGRTVISQLGQSAQWLYDGLYGLYNKAVLKALLVEGSPLFEAEGDYSAVENGVTRQGRAMLSLYESCLCILPPDENARRVPLCFLNSIIADDCALTLILSESEQYTLSKLGRELSNLKRLLNERLRALQKKTAAWHKKLSPKLSPAQAGAAASLMPLGTAANIKRLQGCAAPLAQALEQNIDEGRAAQTYQWLSELGGEQSLFIGALPPPEKADIAAIKLTDAATLTTDADAEKETPKPILWFIAPVFNDRYAAVELALADNEAAATYLYRINGERDAFIRTVDRALEAAAFRREMIFMSDEELDSPEHIFDAMLIKRTAVLSLLRKGFAGRAIHSSFERWQSDIEKCCEETQAVKPAKPKAVCKNCGASPAPDAKFCGQCGSRL